MDEITRDHVEFEDRGVSLLAEQVPGEEAETAKWGQETALMAQSPGKMSRAPGVDAPKTTVKLASCMQ